jgi:DNA polymerase-1
MTNLPKRLYLVDGMSQVFRAYYAIRGLSTATGIPTNAVYGFTMMLRKHLTQEKPDYMAVVLDSAAPTFRHEAYAAYKATRTEMPDDLALQLPYIQRACDVFNVPVVRMPGFEADDLIGTLARLAEEQGLDTVIITQDKDLAQLVTDHVTILREERNGSSTRVDKAGVLARMGVTPSQVVDLLGLQGDTSDNIPGAPGIGEKGAVQIIQQFGSIEAALQGWANVQRKAYRESLRDNSDIIRQSRELARIKVDCPVTLDLAALEVRPPDRAAAYRLFRELEFAILAREFADAAQAVEEPTRVQVAQPVRFRSASTVAAVRSLVDELMAADRLAISCVTTAAGLCGVAFSASPSQAAYVDLAGSDDPAGAFSALAGLLENGLVAKSVHDWKAALHALNGQREMQDPERAAAIDRAVSACGQRFPWDGAVRLGGVEDDTMLAAYLLDPNRGRYALPDLANDLLKRDLDAALDGFDALAARGLLEAVAIGELAGHFRARLQSQDLLNIYTRCELPLVEILYEIERIGLRVDAGRLEAIGVEIGRDLAALERRIYEVAGRSFNINSPSQLAKVLEDLNIVVKRKTAKGKISTSRDVLDELAETYELPRLVIEYRELSKLRGTYVEALPLLIDTRTGRIHTTLNQTVAATGRLSSSNPNLQNIPVRTPAGQRIRDAFVPPTGCRFVSADYSQIELRVLAHIARDESMRAAFLAGEDIHAATARAVFGATTIEEEKEKRRLAKIVNFAIAYSVGAPGLAQRTGLSRKAAKEAIDSYYDAFKGVRAYMEETPRSARETGLVRTIFGRIRPIPDIANKNPMLRSRAEREAINAPIQGSAADLMKLAMLAVHRALETSGLHARIVMQVHDELLLEAPADEVAATQALVRGEMESVAQLDVPLVVDVGAGETWMTAKGT